MKKKKNLSCIVTFYKQFHVRHSHLEYGQVLLFLQSFTLLKNPSSFVMSLYIPSLDRFPWKGFPYNALTAPWAELSP